MVNDLWSINKFYSSQSLNPQWDIQKIMHIPVSFILDPHEFKCTVQVRHHYYGGITQEKPT